MRQNTRLSPKSDKNCIQAMMLKCLSGLRANTCPIPIKLR
ncbi:Uncharacterised protein [Vibrio cholerae]|nr:Uncharacterised protein [Vibrio cholerae]